MKKIFDFIGSIGKDKILHFAVCLVITLLAGGLIKLCGGDETTIIAGAWFAGFAAGVAKELYDEHKYQGADEMDWLADVVGVVVGLVIVVLFVV